MADGDLFDAMAALRDAATEILDTAAPDRIAVVNGNPVFDDTDQMTVHCAGFGPWPTEVSGGVWGEGLQQQMAGPVQAILMVTLLRCGPKLSTNAKPRPGELERVALVCSSDAWRLLNGFRRRIEADTLGDGLVDPVVGLPTPVDEEGGATGWQLPISVTLSGYSPEV